MAEAAKISSKKSTHTYKCQICEKTFNHKGTFDRHVKTVHLEEKNYKCEECHKQFSSNWLLKRHNNDVHKRLKKFGCPECPENYAQVDNLERHIKRGKHTFEYTCNHCDETFKFTSEKSLQRFFWNEHLIDQYKSKETCTGALNLSEDKKIELLRRRKERQREENAREEARRKWRGNYGDEYEADEKKLIAEYKEGLDKAMEDHIKDHKQFWWWHNEYGIRVSDEMPHSKRKSFISARLHEEKRKDADKKRMEENKREEQIRKQIFKCSICEKSIRGLESRHLRFINEYTLPDGTVRPKSTECETIMLCKKWRQAALKREGVLEFVNGYLICGCGCGSKQWESNFHY